MGLLTRKTAAAVVTLALFSLCGCGGGESRSDGPMTATEALDRLDIDPSAIPEEQRAFFADDRITFAEYQEAVEGQWACLDSSGWFTLGPIELQNDGSLGFTQVFEAGDGPGVEDSALDSVDLDCRSRFVQVTGMVWSLGNVLSVEERGQLRPQVISCVNDAGLDIMPNATDADVYDALNTAFGAQGDPPSRGVDLDAARACVEEFYSYFIVMPPT